MSIFDDLTADLDWREGELGALKILLQRQDTTETQKEVLLRAAWALLYAHYEVFSKFCLTKFFDEAARRLPTCEPLPPQTLAFAISQHVQRIRNLPAVEALSEIHSFSDFLANTRPSFPDVDTKSNLWPSVMKELLEKADIALDCIDFHNAILRTLVSRRNEIAHGQKNLIAEVDYYITYENAVYDVMYNLAFSVDERLSASPYS